jgi:pectate lyase
MKLNNILTLAVAALSQASYAVPLVKRTDVNEVCSIGYATTNGGTKGGQGGSVVTVTSLSALKSAVSGESAAIVIVSGTITGNEVVKVGSNKSVLGKNSSASRSSLPPHILHSHNLFFQNFKESV